MKRKGILALTLAAALTLAVAGVAYAAKTYRTQIVFLGADGPSASDVTLFGDLNSNSKCVGARELGLFRETSRGFKLVDADLSSFNGAWALRANLSSSPNLAIKVKKEKRNHGNVVCKGRTRLLSPAKASYPDVG